MSLPIPGALGEFALGQFEDFAVAGILDATDEEDVAAFEAFIIASGVLDATDEEDEAVFIGVRSEEGVLDATDEADEVEMRGRVWAVFGEACAGKTICATGQRAKDPDLEGSLRDRDTATCDRWKRAA